MLVVKRIFHRRQRMWAGLLSLEWCIAFIILPSSKNENTVIISGSLFGVSPRSFICNSEEGKTVSIKLIFRCNNFIFPAVWSCRYSLPPISAIHIIFSLQKRYVQLKSGPKDRIWSTITYVTFYSGIMLCCILSVFMFSEGQNVTTACRSKFLFHLDSWAQDQ